MIFKWTKQDEEVKIQMGGHARGLMRRGERPDLLIIHQQEMDDITTSGIFRDDPWKLERYIAHILKPTLAIGGTLEIVSSCKISI